METAELNESVLRVRWESNPKEVSGSPKDGAAPRMLGPLGEYLEVVDVDPASGLAYEPVDLNDPHLIAQDGLTPSEESPQFHQQMVYAVAMTTIDHFETALGRVALWAPRRTRDAKGKHLTEYVPRLRIYPHALREANAYYSPAKKALLFGYFPTPVGGGERLVFTCLSHDVIAHETAHALLDGLHRRFIEATNPDVHALHEAFADIVALFQHFSNPDVLEYEIARTRGDLESQNMLGQLAQQFGQAIGRRGALRDALGTKDPKTGRWQRKEPDPGALEGLHEPHRRGAILVASVFDAFLAIYKTRIADLLRIATQGTGVLPKGQIHPDLVKRMASEAAKSARHVLQMCIRALDYCPPVDVSFGAYLRAVMTGDYDLHRDDPHKYRVAFAEAFRGWGIFPEEVRAYGVESLRHATLPDPRISAAALWPNQPEKARVRLDWDLRIHREHAWKRMRKNAIFVRNWLLSDDVRRHLPAFGLTIDRDAPPSVTRSRLNGLPAIEVHAVRTAQRKGPRGAINTELLVEVTQKRYGWLDPSVQAAVDAGRRLPAGAAREGDFAFRRGCTLLIDPAERQVRYAIRTRGDIADDRELDRLRQYLRGGPATEDDAFHGRAGRPDEDVEDLMHIHRGA